MKMIFFFLILCIAVAHVSAQDSLRYGYAILEINLPNKIVHVTYSNNTEETLIGKLKLLKENDRIQVLFLCFQYLNDKGYEVVSSNFYMKYLPLTASGSQEITSEYLFKKKIRTK